MDGQRYRAVSYTHLYADENKIAVVMPAGYDSFYTNWHEGCDGAQYYTYITEELFHTPVSYTHLDVYKRQVCGN